VAEERSGLIASIRDRIAEALPLPPGRRAPLRYDLVHSSLARYRSSTAVPDLAVARIEECPVSVRVPVGEIRLVRETLFPCQVVDDIASVRLGRRPD